MRILDNVPSGWKELTINDAVKEGILEKPLDGNHGEIHPKGDDFVQEGIPFIMASDLKNGNVDLINCSFIKKEQAQSLRKGFAKSGDVLLSHKATVGRVALLHTNLDYIVLTPQVTYYRIKDKSQLFNVYLRYYFQNNIFQKILNNYAGGGSTRAYIGITRQLDLPITLPPLPEQKAIANILSSLDDKIKLLQAQNETLESISHAIFKEWFGKYQIGDKLPEGWSVDVIDNLVDLIIDYRGKTPKKLGLDWSESGIPALSAKIIKNGKIVRRDAMNFGNDELYKLWMKDELKKGDVLLTSEAPLGELYYLNDDKKYILSQRLFALRSNKIITSEYLYYYLFSINGQALLKARASGSTVEGIRQSELRMIEVIIPEKEILQKASDIFKSAFNKIFTNEEQIQVLMQTRDNLLPKLISGKIRVNDFIK
jgi:type I restriction enzyme S subunit